MSVFFRSMLWFLGFLHVVVCDCSSPCSILIHLFFKWDGPPNCSSNSSRVPSSIADGHGAEGAPRVSPHPARNSIPACRSETQQGKRWVLGEIPEPTIQLEFYCVKGLAYRFASNSFCRVSRFPETVFVALEFKVSFLVRMFNWRET